jgi:murein peptide amidase A
MRRRLLTATAVAVTACSTTPVASTHPSATPASTRKHATQTRSLSDALVRRRIVLGYSVQHRPILAEQIGDPDSQRRVVIVGCIHGDEPGGIAVTRALAKRPPVPETNLWLLPDLNPDGAARGQRTNGDGVDLNRNFPYRWRPLGREGSKHYAGPRPLSEPESRIAISLLRRERPTLAIWYHQALDVVDVSQGPTVLERKYAAAADSPVRSLPDYPGSAVGYEDHVFGPTAFVVELPARVTATIAARNVAAVVRLIA